MSIKEIYIATSTVYFVIYDKIDIFFFFFKNFVMYDIKYIANVDNK